MNIVSIVSSVSARKLKSPSSARLGTFIARLEQENSSSNSSLINRYKVTISHYFSGWILCHLWGIMMLLLPRASANIGTRIDLPTDYSVLIAILAYCIVGSYQILKSPQFGQNWRLLKCITLLEISILSSAMALSNFRYNFQNFITYYEN
jgi:nitrate reductase gamma subunit